MYSANKASNHASASRTTDMSQGCPIPVGNNVCGEPNSLEIMKEFNRLYEERMEQVDSEAAGDCLQEKIKLQREWIRNLTQQNDMLVRAVQELEYEATERVQQLEGKLQKSAQCLCEVMKKYREHDFAADLLAEPLQNISHLEDDIKNVLEFVRRIREDRKWSLDGLFFYSISGKDLMGAQCEYSNKFTDDDSREGESKLQEKERTIQELTEKLNYYNSFGNVEDIAKELQSRRSECESLKQEMADMRHALTEEVAAKHDQLVVLRKDLQVFEERCMQADKQTAFKEDIIRELRKEVKQLKQQISIPEKPLSLSQKNLSSTSQPKQPSLCEIDKPYIIVNHSSKKQPGKNTVIYINKDGSVHKEENTQEGTSRKPSAISKSREHTDICSKCKEKLNGTRSFFPICKSESELISVKNTLKPVKERSKLTNRCKTFVDQTKRILNEIEFEEFCHRERTESRCIPVKMHVDYLEKKSF